MKSLLLFFCTLLPVNCYAFFCPTNFQQIDFGDSAEHVKQICGAPDKEVSKEVEAPTPQEWTYYIPQTVSAGMMNQTSGTLKTTIAFDKEGKAINISVNGIGVGATTICKGSNLPLGATMNDVKNACGRPSAINKQEAENADNQPKKKMTQFIYSSANPPVTLIFENGRLTDKQ